MNNTTQQPQMQAPSQPSQKPVLPANEAIAHLGFINALHKQLLQYKAGRNSSAVAPQMPQDAPGQAEPQETSNGQGNDLEAKIDQKLEVLRDELKGNQKIELDSIKKMIEDALNDNGQQG